MKKLSSLVMLLAGLFCMSAKAEQYNLTPSAVTTIDPASADANFYNATATSWLVSQGALSGTNLKSFSLPYLLMQFDLTSLEGTIIQAAEMSYDSKCTVSGKNSNVVLYSISNNWTASTVTWNTIATAANAVQISAGTGQNVKTTKVNLKEDVLNFVKDEAGKTVAFAICTYTAREQEISNIKLTLTAVSASAAADVKLTYMCGEQIIKQTTTTATKGNTVTLSAEEKASFLSEDGSKKYIYVSDNGAEVTVTDDSEVIIQMREAARYKYAVVSSQGGNVSEGEGFEGDVLTVGYPRYQLIDGTLYEAPKTNDSKKQYNCTITLNENHAVYNMTYNEVKTGVVYYAEAEFMSGLTEVTYGNVNVRASNSRAAKATADTKITTLPAGKYQVYAGVFSSAKSPAYVIKIAVGDNTYEAPVTAVNNSEVHSEEYTLKTSTDVTLLAEGMGDNNALDYLYIVKTGDVEPLTLSIETNMEDSTITITPSDLTAPYYCGVLNPTLMALWSFYNDSMQVAFHASVIAEIESQAALEAAYRTGVQTIYMNDFADLGTYKVLAAAMHYDADAEGNINYFVIDSEVATTTFEIKEKENPGPTPETVTFEVVAGTTTFTVTPSDLEVEYYIDVVEAGTYSAENLKDFGMASVEEYFDFLLKEMGSGLEYFSGVQTQSYEDDWYIDESGDYEIRIFAVSNEYKRISDISLTPFTFSDPTSLNAVESAVKAVAGKMMTDGKLTIVKNGVRYNAQGMMVK